VFFKDETGTYRCRALEDIEWLEHGFGTRHSSNWPSDGPLAWVHQVHSNRCLVTSGLDGCAGEADALITDRPGQWVSVHTADCPPLLIVAERPRVVAAVHAGWRGSADRIAAETVRRMCDRFGVEPAALRIAMGPAIGACCYEVGTEVADRFRDLLPELPAAGKVHLDLARANVRQLVDAGVRPERIFSGAPCTFCNAGDFHSYRRAPGERGRMVSAIRIRPDKSAPGRGPMARGGSIDPPPRP
jgi:YfiH family protein